LASRLFRNKDLSLWNGGTLRVAHGTTNAPYRARLGIDTTRQTDHKQSQYDVKTKLLFHDLILLTHSSNCGSDWMT
jgi:hypothetical protein